MRQPDGGYEALDTKLARHARPAHILQLCFYTEQIARIQGRMPEAMHVVNGLGERETFRPDDYLAYYRRLRERFLAAVENRADTYPYPVEHCGLCEFLRLCKQQWEEDDHLTLVAGVSRAQVERLTAAGITTLEALGDAPPETRVRKMRPTTFANLRHQAELQLHRRRTASTASTCCRSSPSAASRSCPSRTRATSGSTSRATPGSSRRAGSSTSSAGSSSTRTGSRATTASGRTTGPRSGRPSSGSST